MRIEFKALKGLDRDLLLYGGAILLSVAGIAGMSWHLGTLEAAVDSSRRELDQAEQQVQSVVLPGEDERREWTTDENLLLSRLLTDSEIPLFFQDITRLATLHQLERFSLETEDRVIDPGAEAPPEDSLPQSVGIPGYLIVTLNFSGDYRSAAEFIQAVGQLPRLTEFRSIDLRRNAPNVDVTMALRVYKREEAAA